MINVIGLVNLDTRLKYVLRGIMINVIGLELKLEYAGGVWEGDAKLVKQLETVERTAASGTRMLKYDE